MNLISETITYILLFVALYVEVFLLINYFEFREKEKKTQRVWNPVKIPSVSIIVPVWNEENTVVKTVFSLLRLNYPKDKLKILVVDDGSVDKTWNVLQRFARNKQVKLLRKENGGKHTALNFALEFVGTELVGCLDADSFVHPEALKRIVPHFEDSEIMAVTPSVKVFEPRGLLQMIQKAEYMFGIFLRQVFSYLNSIYITPGPFSIFRRSVFDQIGLYRKAYNTEDMEIAMRMQRHRMKIESARNAFVYTVAPKSFYGLYKQRLRWAYGFLKNAIDYRDMFFKPQYGHLGMVVLPAAGFSFFSTLYFFGSVIVSWVQNLWLRIKEISTIGFSAPSFNFDLFYFNTDVLIFLGAIGIVGTLFIIFTSRRMAEERRGFGFDSLLFLALYTLIAPFWMFRALFNVIFARKTNWR